MIHTSIYDDHTPGPWKLDDRIWEMYLGLEPDVMLMQDAPLLLEEVKRHRPPKVDGKYMAWSDSHPKHDRRTWIEQVMEGITDAGYWTWVNWQLQYGDEEE